ncbi:hypothetical protein V2I01_30860 [Micromonospora sp. BRA006-A]|nr:hypothetical protein [Micromonospora sp. BRA006-A]
MSEHLVTAYGVRSLVLASRQGRRPSEPTSWCGGWPRWARPPAWSPRT